MKLLINENFIIIPFLKGESRRSREGGLKAMPAGRQGFTLIELLVVVGVLGIILITMSTVLINSTRAKNRTAIIQNLDTNGNRILDKIKYNLINADPATIVCPVGPGSSITFNDKMGGGDSTALICSEGADVASVSAINGHLGLNTGSVVVSGCGNFVSCNIVGTGVQSMDIKF
ncbi:MAG: type II secretion system protein, partial [Candidatus Shapirobacteria bacterium]|nr:type II secretion system protein [Candidatus Shapirobacteria bacterium]